MSKPTSVKQCVKRAADEDDLDGLGFPGFDDVQTLPTEQVAVALSNVARPGFLNPDRLRRAAAAFRKFADAYELLLANSEGASVPTAAPTATEPATDTKH
jgi:hypothetical protein